eukprot:scaffold216780_cov35-Attheya_sp.AAC.1
MAATALSETDLKNIIFHGMPTSWQENFVHANMRISSITLAQSTETDTVTVESRCFAVVLLQIYRAVAFFHKKVLPSGRYDWSARVEFCATTVPVDK